MREAKRASTVGDLRKSDYQVVGVREELRQNLRQQMKSGQEIFPGIISFGDTVIPPLQNAILAGQDIIVLSERGQAKSRLIRSLVSLLDESIPVIAGCEINDNPYAPICQSCREKVARHKDNVRIAWRSREERYSEKLATPDISIADLIGEVDPIRVAEGRYLSDELTIHYGLIPRANRGIFCINELPDLPERIQVGLFNLMQERDLQIRGYSIRLAIDILIIASANPEDYTNRGRIITPLKDRYGAQVRTHYPKTIEDEISIMEQEHAHFPDGDESVSIPRYIKEIIAEVTALARRSPDINQRFGVSVRMSIANYESLISNSLRRAINLGEARATPRICDLPAIVASSSGKIELETVEDGREAKLVEDLSKNAVLNVFGHYFNPNEFVGLIKKFEDGLVAEVGEGKPSSEYMEFARQDRSLSSAIERLVYIENPAEVASAVEFLLEGLHLNRRLNRDTVDGKSRYMM